MAMTTVQLPSRCVSVPLACSTPSASTLPTTGVPSPTSISAVPSRSLTT